MLTETKNLLLPKYVAQTQISTAPGAAPERGPWGLGHGSGEEGAALTPPTETPKLRTWNGSP